MIKPGHLPRWVLASSVTNSERKVRSPTVDHHLAAMGNFAYSSASIRYCGEVRLNTSVFTTACSTRHCAHGGRDRFVRSLSFAVAFRSSLSFGPCH